MSARSESAAGAGREAGVATVFACLGVAVLLVLTGIGLHVGAAAIARHRAEAAADLAALAGASWALRGPESACTRAADLARANGAVLTSCRLDGLDVLIEVSVSVVALGTGGTAAARARAGPITDLPP